MHGALLGNAAKGAAPSGARSACVCTVPTVTLVGSSDDSEGNQSTESTHTRDSNISETSNDS